MRVQEGARELGQHPATHLAPPPPGKQVGGLRLGGLAPADFFPRRSGAREGTPWKRVRPEAGRKTTACGALPPDRPPASWSSLLLLNLYRKGVAEIRLARARPGAGGELRVTEGGG
jgi:hypothetical protein